MKLLLNPMIVFENSLGKNKDMSRIKRKIPPNKSSPETVVQDVEG